MPEAGAARSDAILSLDGVMTDIAQYHILKGVSFDVPRGQVTMLLGRNGVGKTTTMRTIMGLWSARAGRITFDGEDITGWPVSARARAGIGFVPEDMGIFSDLTVEENMTLAAASAPLDPDRRDWLFGAFPPLKTFWRSPAGTLSGGQKQMLSIARAMAESRSLYLIDEPTKGLAPAIVSTMVTALRELKRQGASILLVEQNFSVARALGDAAVVMDDGAVVWTGEMAELARDKGLQERLMGLSMEV
jgi:branched-chain amino acid transport system ATP-binding protein